MHFVEARQGARTDTEFQSRLRVMDIDEAGGAQVMGSAREAFEWNHLQTNQNELERATDLILGCGSQFGPQKTALIQPCKSCKPTLWVASLTWIIGS